MVNLSERQRITTELLGAVDWQSETSGFVTCAGKHLHTSGDNQRDCKIDLDGAPTVHCFHTSCRGLLQGVNHELRSRIGKAEYQPKHESETSGLLGAGKGMPEPVLDPPVSTQPARIKKFPTSVSNSDDDTIRQLAALSPLEYDRRREAEAKKLGCKVATLDKLVEAKRPSETQHGLQGSAAICPDVELWPEAVDGAAVLNDVAETFKRYVALPDGAAEALALWCAHTHCFECFTQTPRLNVTSPERGCGKSTLRDVATLFVRRPLPLENMTTATAFRLVEKFTPTILADEVDSWLIKDNPELVGFLNSGHRRGGFYTRCEGENNEPRTYRAYAPAALCGIGNLPGTLHDRSIVIKLARAKPGEVRARFDSRHTAGEAELCRKLARFCADNKARLAASDPKLPDGVFNRLADNWRPLFAIAEIVGGDWRERCASALAKLTSHDSTDVETLKVMLLADIRQVIIDNGLGSEDWIASGDLIDFLTANPEWPWSEANRGKQINERWLSVKLGAFGIKPGKLPRDGGRQHRGYNVTTFRDAFDRYLASPPVTSGQVSHSPVLREENSETDTKSQVSQDVSQTNPSVSSMAETDARETGTDNETDVKITSVSAIYEGKNLSETDVHLKKRAEHGEPQGMTPGEFLAEATRLFNAKPATH
jgi:putative DNA primase/helicase